MVRWKICSRAQEVNEVATAGNSSLADIAVDSESIARIPDRELCSTDYHNSSSEGWRYS